MLRLDWNLVFTIINLIVLYLLLRKFLIRPIMEIMDKRKAMIEDGINNANDAKAQAMELKQQYEDSLTGVKQESGVMIEQARKEAKAEYGRIVEDADMQAEKILKAARDKMNLEKEQALREMKSQVAGLAMEAAKKIVIQQGGEKSNQAVYDHFLEETGDSHDDTDNL